MGGQDRHTAIRKHRGWSILKEKVDIALQIAEALRYLHDCRFVYRDLKPSNTGLINHNDADAPTIVKLFDFGTCRRLPSEDSATESSKTSKDKNYRMSFVGSPRYMAPEMYGGHEYNQSVDVYSWSILFYEMLSLEQAFPNSYNMDDYHREVYTKCTRPQFDDFDDSELMFDLTVPQEIQKIIECSWTQDPSERYSSHEVCEKLEIFSEKNFVLPLSEDVTL